MVHFVSLLVVSICTICALGDKTPSWEEYSVKSTNGVYIADIRAEDKRKSDKPWEWEYSVTIRSLTNRTGSVLWKSPYRHRGYSEGELTDDGEVFVYVEQWYLADYPVIQIYKRGTSLPMEFRGKDLPVEREKVRRPGTHYLWLDDEGPSVCFEKKDGIWYVIVQVVGEKTVRINTGNGMVQTERRHKNTPSMDGVK